MRGRWGGPPPDKQQVASGPVAATDLAFVPRGKLELARVVRSDVPEIGVKSAAAPDSAPPASGDTTAKAPDKPIPAKKEKNGCAVGGTSSGGALVLLALLALRRRRRP